MWCTARYLKSVDKFNEWTISAFVTPGSEDAVHCGSGSVVQKQRSNMSALLDMKFILLHETRNDDGIKSFFTEVWELYVKVSEQDLIALSAPNVYWLQTMLNPFHTAHTPIRSAVFDGRVRASAKKYL